MTDILLYGILVMYLIGFVLGFGTALDLIEQSKEVGYEYTSKWALVKYWLDPRNRKSRITHETRREIK